jgi:hypothetical protein
MGGPGPLGGNGVGVNGLGGGGVNGTPSGSVGPDPGQSTPFGGALNGMGEAGGGATA